MKCYKCPDCGGELVERGNDYYCKKCDEYFTKRFIQKCRREEYED